MSQKVYDAAYEADLAAYFDRMLPEKVYDAHFHINRGYMTWHGLEGEPFPYYRNFMEKYIGRPIAGGLMMPQPSSKHTKETLRDNNLYNLKVAQEEGFAAAEDFLKKRGYRNMERTAWKNTGDALAVSFCPLQDGVRCYADEITLTVALDDGSLLSFDATDYVQNHRRRTPERPQASAEDARSLLSPSLTAEEEFLAWLPMPGGGEKLCFTFRCLNAAGRRWLVFSSAATGAQERIVRVLESETGLETL